MKRGLVLMSWRTVIISNRCKLSYKNDYLVIRNEEVQMIHLSEINTIVIDTCEVSITSYLINEVAQRKIKIIFCDEKKNPSCELIPYYGSHNTSKKILYQMKWEEDRKKEVWKEIVKFKIYNQATVLKLFKIAGYEKLLKYIDEVELGDATNREGHAAKVYFNLLFGKDFYRDKDCEENKALDYGYSIILSNFNKEVVSNGYMTQIGINHRNEFNFFNLSCDLMEIYRPIVDAVVKKSIGQIFDKSYKYKLINILNMKVKIAGKEQFISNAIPLYIKSVFNALEFEDDGKVEEILNYEL